MRADGSGKTQLTDFHSGNIVADMPKMSPDGSKVAFVVCDGSGNSSLEVMNIDGTSREAVAPVVSGTYFFCWSPDSKKVAFAKPVNGTYIRMRDIETMSPAVTVTDEANAGNGVTWSPDGGRLAYIGSSNRLCVVYLNGTAVTSIEEILPNNSGYPRFSSVDTNLIAFKLSGWLTIIDMSSFPYQTTSLETSTNYAHVFSPDGEWVYYCKESPAYDYDIYRVKKDGSGKQSLTDDITSLSAGDVSSLTPPATEPNEFSPRFFPGSSRVFFSVLPPNWKYNPSEVYSMNADGTGKARLTDDSHMDLMEYYETD